MSKMPKMNLWVDAFNSDTCFLSNEELGIYFRLIFFAWSRGGYLPDDIEFIYCLAPNAEEKTINKVMKLYWTKDGERGYYQKRLREEYLRAEEVTEKNRQNAQSRYATAERPQSDRTPSISKSISKSNKDQKLLLATKDKAELYVLEDSYNQSKEEINDIINTMAVALTECNSVEELLLRYYPNWENWKLSIKQKEELRQVLRKTHDNNYWRERQDLQELSRGV